MGRLKPVILVVFLIALGYGCVFLNAVLGDLAVRKYMKQGLSREAAKAKHKWDLEQGGF